jgi:hypothetical protein
VSVSVNGTTVSAATGADGRFAAVIPTAGLTTSGSPYAVAVSYDGSANFEAASGSSTLRVVDTTAPAISGAFAYPSLLLPTSTFWPVYIGYTATDASGGAVCGLSVTSNDPTARDPRTVNDIDWIVLGRNLVLLRAERVSAPAPPRAYLVTITCGDPSGNKSSAFVLVPVLRP